MVGEFTFIKSTSEFVFVAEKQRSVGDADTDAATLAAGERDVTNCVTSASAAAAAITRQCKTSSPVMVQKRRRVRPGSLRRRSNCYGFIVSIKVL